MRRSRFQLGAVAAFAAIAFVACESTTPTAPDSPTGPEGAAFDHVPDDEDFGHLEVCKVGTDADFTVSVDGGAATSFSLVDGDCVDAFVTPAPGAYDVVVTEVASPDYTLTGITRVQDGVDAYFPGGPITDNPTGPSVTTTVFNDMKGTITFFNDPVVRGGDGCTPGYWKNHTEFKNTDAWIPTGLATGDSYDATFIVASSFGGTLLDALRRGGGKEKALGRHATAALLNALHPDVAYAHTSAEVIQMVQDAYASGDFNGAKDVLAEANEGGCPL